MFFAHAICISSTYGKDRIAICSCHEDIKKCESKNDSILRLHYEMPLAQEILKIAALNKQPYKFVCNEVEYELIKYTTSEEERLFNEYRRDYIAGEVIFEIDKEICVYTSQCRCPVCFGKYKLDNIENVRASIPLKDDPKRRVYIDVQHCKTCDQYLIDSQSLKIYEDRYGLLSMLKYHIRNCDYFNVKKEYEYKPQTVLSQYGYSTSKIRSERRAIIDKIIKNGWATKSKIKGLFSGFIYSRCERCPEGRIAWIDDLEYVNSLKLNEQKTVVFK